MPEPEQLLRSESGNSQCVDQIQHVKVVLFNPLYVPIMPIVRCTVYVIEYLTQNYY